MSAGYRLARCSLAAHPEAIDGSRRASADGKFYRHWFEICMHRHEPFRQPWCWNDMLVINRANTELKRRIFTALHGTPERGTGRFGEQCECV
jgi:hypothetical protein